MKKSRVVTLAVTCMMSTTLFAGCGSNATSTTAETSQQEAVLEDTSTVAAEEGTFPAISLQFGYDGPVYTATLEQNDTATTLVRYTSQGEYNLPIYTYENYENEDVLQYYDIPGRYEIPSEPELITEEKAGELYYSSPNRVILFYEDANIEGEFTKIGQIEDIEGLADAVRNNQPLEDWNCLVIPVRVIE